MIDPLSQMKQESEEYKVILDDADLHDALREIFLKVTNNEY